LTRTRRSLRTDFLVGGLILAFTAVPIELRVPGQQVLLEALRLNVFPIDIAANVLGYVPLGIVLRSRGAWSALLIAAVLSVSAELTQVFTVDRMPAVVDVATNLLGASLGLFLPRRLGTLPEQIWIGPSHALLAAAVAVAYVFAGSSFTVEAVLRHVRVAFEAPPWMSTNPRGSLAAGTVEARLSFDRIDDDVIADASDNRLRATAVNEPTLSRGEIGSAILVNGKQWVDLGNPVALRLTGSMTLSAWIRPTSFPVDDAAIISSLTDDELGYQLDLTIDQGPRTIGFKIADASGRLMARYGKTAVALDRWYHVAGVYDSGLQTLNVYLNGVLDNGCLMGSVTDRQVASGRHAFVGRRAGMAGFEFIGSIDEVTIESTAKPASEIFAEASAARLGGPSVAVPSSEADRSAENRCARQPRARIAGPLVLLGMLIAVACAGLLPGKNFVFWTLGLCLVVGSTAGIWALPTAVSAWPGIWCVPFGGIVVVAAANARLPR
jgi:concanavalin A-like lectin/glucanase superfamily protein/VanZ like protein